MDMNTTPVPTNVSNQQAQTTASKSSSKTEKRDTGKDRRTASKSDKKGKDTFDTQLSKAKQSDEKPVTADAQKPAEDSQQDVLEKKDPPSETKVPDKKTENAKDEQPKDESQAKTGAQPMAASMDLLALLTPTVTTEIVQAKTDGEATGNMQTANGGAAAEKLPVDFSLPVSSLDALLPKDAAKTTANENMLALLTSKATLSGSVQKDEKTATIEIVQAMLEETKGQPATDEKSATSLLSLMKNANQQNLQSVISAPAVPQPAASVELSSQAVQTSLAGETVKNSETTAIQQSVNGAVLQQAVTQTPGNAISDLARKNSKVETGKSGEAKAADRNAAEVKQDLFSLAGLTAEKTQTEKPVTPLAAQLQDMQQKAALVSEAKEEAGAAKDVLSELSSGKDETVKKETTTLDAGKAMSAAITPFADTLKQSATAVHQQNPKNMEAYEIPKQIVEQARLIKSAENSQMVIKLNPDHLGELVLKVSVSSNGSVNASFHSDNADVRNVIENSLVQLRQELQSQGLKVDNVGVYAGLGDLMSNGQSSQMDQQQAGSHARHRQIRLDEVDEEMELSAISATEGLNTEDGIDYRI